MTCVHGHNVTLKARVLELEAERDEEHTAVRELERANTRLEALQESCLEKDDDIIRLMQERNDAQSRLAAAAALLTHVPRLPLDLAVDGEYLREVRAFLANQPAAPNRGCIHFAVSSDAVCEECQPAETIKARASSGGPCPCGAQERSGHPVGWCAEQDAKRKPTSADPWKSEPEKWCGHCQGRGHPVSMHAAPIYAVEHEYPEVTGYEAPTRTEAEQAVLDAMSLVTVYSLRDEIASGNYFELSEACRAELARRGMK